MTVFPAQMSAQSTNCARRSAPWLPPCTAAGLGPPCWQPGGAWHGAGPGCNPRVLPEERETQIQGYQFRSTCIRRGEQGACCCPAAAAGSQEAGDRHHESQHVALALGLVSIIIPFGASISITSGCMKGLALCQCRLASIIFRLQCCSFLLFSSVEQQSPLCRHRWWRPLCHGAPPGDVCVYSI